MRSRLGRWYWYKHKVWGWLEVKVIATPLDNVFQCFSPPAMIYLLNGADLKTKRGVGKIYPYNPGHLR